MHGPQVLSRHVLSVRGRSVGDLALRVILGHDLFVQLDSLIAGLARIGRVLQVLGV
jgi:hypothetical protein